jgi:hypothetical protein
MIVGFGWKNFPFKAASQILGNILSKNIDNITKCFLDINTYLTLG